ncbi:MAG: hypothetical protein ABIM83_05470, partial [candidate division WOR-3 bacterium]
MEKECKEIIDKIRETYTKGDSFLIKQLKATNEKIQGLFPRYGSFLLEFIQNADDAMKKSEEK